MNALSPNGDKTCVIKLNVNHRQVESFKILYQGKEIKEVKNMRFLVLGIDKHMDWKTHIEQII